MIKVIILTVSMLFTNLTGYTQDKTEGSSLSQNGNPDGFEIIPDKIFEIGVPLLLVFFLLNILVQLLRNRAEHILKIKMIEKGISEDALIKIFKESNAILKFQMLKWFLFTLSISFALITIHLGRSYFINQSGYLAVGIFLLFISAAFLIYYKVLSNKL